MAKELREMMQYAADSAGGVMDPAVTMFRPDATVKSVIKRLRQSRKKHLTHVFIVDADGKLTGAASLQNIFLSDKATTLQDIPKEKVISIQATALRQEVTDTFNEHEIASVPVVDYERKLLGVIRHDVLFEAAESEATADIQTMVGVSKDERALSNVWFSVRKPLPSLQINLVTAFLAASVVGLFEETIAKMTALAVLLPVVAGQSGNTEAQALAVTLRGLVLREVRVRHWPQLSGKEITVGAINGLAVAIVFNYSHDHYRHRRFL